MKVMNVPPPPPGGLICLHGELYDGTLSHCRSASGTGLQDRLQQIFLYMNVALAEAESFLKKPVTAFQDTAGRNTPAVVACGWSCQ